MRPRAASSVRPSQMTAWHTGHANGYFIQCLPAYRRFRGIAIPWDRAAELAETTEEIAKSTRSRKVVKLAAGHFGTPLEIYVKRYNFKTWYGPYLRAVRRSRAREEFELGWALTDAGIKTPRPVWLAEDESSLPRCSIIATEAIPDAENVMQRWSRLGSEVERRELLTALGRFLHPCTKAASITTTARRGMSWCGSNRPRTRASSSSLTCSAAGCWAASRACAARRTSIRCSTSSCRGTTTWASASTTARNSSKPTAARRPKAPAGPGGWIASGA